jgi:hypothetical protein
MNDHWVIDDAGALGGSDDSSGLVTGCFGFSPGCPFGAAKEKSNDDFHNNQFIQSFVV